ncbi:helix-turn-helix domain-containing protein [Nitrosococcus wardiae]|uniref:DNA-binding protein n=1 Tax=Nitrosococcus wardiae TaxID=1814290 RepID=A0A4P7BU14_9GAMM|nr:helix-turn-helix domain-containing protein [Nitrosococcus wardiae]QBQ53393.1 DNA-binding protein [Nitrosococcus wardiae]
MKHPPAAHILPHLVGPEEAARILGVKPGTLQVWRSTGRVNLPYVKIGGKVKYRLSDLERFIENRLCQHTS